MRTRILVALTLTCLFALALAGWKWNGTPVGSVIWGQ